MFHVIGQDYTARRARPRRRLDRITRRPVAVRILARKPEVRFCLRFVPPNVLLVIPDTLPFQSFS